MNAVGQLTVAGRACTTIGEVSLVHLPLLGLLCSRKCPGDVILGTYDAARALRDAGIAVAGGFHSPMERECLDLLLRGRQPVVYCAARGLETMRISPVWRASIAEGRLLLLSPFPASLRQGTKKTAKARNALVAELADILFISHAAPGGDIERLAKELIPCGRSSLTLASPHNQHMIAMGALAVSPEQLPTAIARLRG